MADASANHSLANARPSSLKTPEQKELTHPKRKARSAPFIADLLRARFIGPNADTSSSHNQAAKAPHGSSWCALAGKADSRARGRTRRRHSYRRLRAQHPHTRVCRPGYVFCAGYGIQAHLSLRRLRAALFGIRPRDVTMARKRAALIDVAPKHVRLWLHLCSDLAMRSGTAAKIAPHNYDPATGLLKFTTKYNERLTLPVARNRGPLRAV